MTDPATTGASATAARRAVLALPVPFGLLLPMLLIAIDPWRRPLETPSLIVGAVMTISGIAMVVRTGRDFFLVGRGTLAPWNPPQELVTVGLFAHSRNPMYLGVLAVLAGLAMASRSPLLGGYLLAAAIAFHLRVVLHEEPWAERNFPEAWTRYRGTVPRWFPRPPRPRRPTGPR